MLTRYASMTVIAAKIAPQGGGPLMRTAHRHEFEYEPKPGFLYVRSRMISSRTNDNFDHFPATEIREAYRTFVGKPVFVNHHNDNHRRARGVIKDAVLHEDVNPDGSEDVWVEGLMEVDAVRFPKLAEAILAGHIDRTSMGTDVAFSVCSVCNNKASSPVEYCSHIPKLKGQKIWRTTASGQKEGVLVYEKCYGLKFFENSLLVEEPADPTAYFLGVDARGLGKAASKTAASTPLIPGHSGRTVRLPGGGHSAECTCGRPFPERSTAQDAWVDMMNHGGVKHPDYDPADAYDREQAWHTRDDVKTPVGRVPDDYLSWSGTNPQNWALVAKTALSAAEEAYQRDLLSRVRQPSGERSKTEAFCTLCSWTGKVNHAVECPSCGDEDYAGRLILPVGAETDLLSRRYMLPGERGAACETCNWSGKVRECARCPGCNSTTHMTFRKRKKHAARTAATYDYNVSLDCGDDVRYIGSTHGQVAAGQDWTCSTHGEVKVSDVSGPGMSNGLGMDKVSSLRRLAEEKVLAPADVDTLRDEQCPVCSEQNAYDGEKCQVCGFITPPSEFGDPDTEKAQQTDLRQQVDDANDAGGDLACDKCGATFSSTPEAPAAKQAVVLDQEKGTEDSDDAATVHSQAGDPCPTCGEGTLQPSAVAPDAAVPEDGFAPAGSGADQAAPTAEGGDEEDDADDSDPADESDDEDGEDGDKPDFLKKKKDSKKPTAVRREVRSQKEQSMRPALAALAAQQKQIEALTASNHALQQTVAFIAEVAGISDHPKVASLTKRAADENPAFGGGWDNGAPVEGSPEAPSESTQEASTPTAKDDVTDVGSTPLTDVTPDATTSLDSTEVVLDVTEPQEQDVTAPVAGTEDLGKGGRGQEGTNRIETDVRAGTPSDNSAAFRDGGFLGSMSPERTMASLRLARLRITAGIATGDDLDLGQAIASSEASDEAISNEISTLDKVVTASKQPQRVARNLVPQGANAAQRMVPSMTAEASVPQGSDSIGSVSGDEMLFEA